MAIIPTFSMNGSAVADFAGGLSLRLTRWGMAALLAVVLTGCVTTGSSLWSDDCCTGKACQMVCVWQNSVMEVPDSANGGVPLKGFAGRVYFFGPTIDFPLLSEGTLTVDLVDETYEPAKWVERWIIDSVTLQRLKKKDMMGWGYTVFLPSKEYHPGMTKIKLRSAFQMENAAPIYTENAVTLDTLNGVMNHRTSNAPMKMQSANNAAPAPMTPRFQPPIKLK